MLWGCVSLAATIILTVVGVMLKDVRWVLFLAWPFASIAVWEFSRLRRAKHVGVITAIGGVLTLVLVAVIYLSLPGAPRPESHAPDYFTSQRSLEVNQLRYMLSEKGEPEIRAVFDIDNMAVKNIRVYADRARFFQRHPNGVFNYQPYMEVDGEMQINPHLVFLKRNGSFSETVTVPNGNAPVTILTTKYIYATRKLSEFSKSPYLTENARERVSALLKAVQSDSELLVMVMNEKLHENKRYFTEAEDVSSPFNNGVINNYYSRFVPLQPYTDDLMVEMTRL